MKTILLPAALAHTCSCMSYKSGLNLSFALKMDAHNIDKNHVNMFFLIE